MVLLEGHDILEEVLAVVLEWCDIFACRGVAYFACSDLEGCGILEGPFQCYGGVWHL